MGKKKEKHFLKKEFLYMKKTSKLLAVILAITMLIPMFSICTFASLSLAYPGLEEERHIVFAGGQTIVESGYWKIKNDGTVVSSTKSNYNIAYDLSTNTLTLKNAKISCGNFTGYGQFSENTYCCIAATKGLNIVIVGKNTLNVNSRDGSCSAIKCYTGELNISGEGELNININYSYANSSYGILAATDLVDINIKDTTVNIDITDRKDVKKRTMGICGKNVKVENSEINITAEEARNAFGFYSGESESLLEVIDSEVNVNFNESKFSSGFEVFSITFKNSIVDININYSDRLTSDDRENFGIYTMSLLVQESYVNILMDSPLNPTKYTPALVYRYFMLDDNSNPEFVSGKTKNIVIEPDNMYYYATSVEFENGSIGDDIYAKIDENGVRKADEDTWNIYLDSETHTLYLKNVVINSEVIIDGFVNIVIEGENVIHNDGDALIAPFKPEISGNGKLTNSSDNSSASSINAEFSESATVKVSTDSDGTDAVEYDSETALSSYKWIEITVEDEPQGLSFWQSIIKFFEDLFKSIKDFFVNLFNGI